VRVHLGAGALRDLLFFFEVVLVLSLGVRLLGTVHELVPLQDDLVYLLNDVNLRVDLREEGVSTQRVLSTELVLVRDVLIDV